MTADEDRADAQGELDEQTKWGESRTGRVLAKVLSWTDRARDRFVVLETDRDTAKAAIQDLRQRVKALEDKVP